MAFRSKGFFKVIFKMIIFNILLLIKFEKLLLVGYLVLLEDDLDYLLELISIVTRLYI
jgi:hypothetical protein